MRLKQRQEKTPQVNPVLCDAQIGKTTQAFGVQCVA